MYSREQENVEVWYRYGYGTVKVQSKYGKGSVKVQRRFGRGTCTVEVWYWYVKAVPLLHENT